MKEPLKQFDYFTQRTYMGGKLLREFLRIENAQDDFFPELWISSFTQAKNPIFIKNEGITRVLKNGKEELITTAVTTKDFGENSTESGVLIKFLDSSERLGVQVHPNKEFAKENFNSAFGKTECWHIINTRRINGEKPCIYLGFKEFVTKEVWKDLFIRQDVNGLLNAMHKFEVKKGDTILVTGGTPHAIGAGCFLLEIQEPSDYTMRVEKTTSSGTLTPMQIHYGVGEEKMLDCFNYAPKTRKEIKQDYFLSNKKRKKKLVSHKDTPCFALEKVVNKKTLNYNACVTLVFLKDGGEIKTKSKIYPARQGDRYFIPANLKITVSGDTLICYPPIKENKC